MRIEIYISSVSHSLSLPLHTSHTSHSSSSFFIFFFLWALNFCFFLLLFRVPPHLLLLFDRVNSEKRKRERKRNNKRNCKTIAASPRSQKSTHHKLSHLVKVMGHGRKPLKNNFNSFLLLIISFLILSLVTWHTLTRCSWVREFLSFFTGLTRLTSPLSWELRKKLFCELERIFCEKKMS